jgi:hypothetical protein
MDEAVDSTRGDPDVGEYRWGREVGAARGSEKRGKVEREWLSGRRERCEGDELQMGEVGR